MHWLSRKPCDIPDHVHAVGATGAVLEAFQQQAADDWQAILLRRAAELAPGGRLVLVNFGVDEEGRYLGNTGGVNMFDTFDADLVDLKMKYRDRIADFAVHPIMEIYLGRQTMDG